MPDSASERIANARRLKREAGGSTASERIAAARRQRRESLAAEAEPDSAWGSVLGNLESSGISTKPRTFQNFEDTGGADQKKRSRAIGHVEEADAIRRGSFVPPQESQFDALKRVNPAAFLLSPVGALADVLRGKESPPVSQTLNEMVEGGHESAASLLDKVYGVTGSADERGRARIDPTNEWGYQALNAVAGLVSGPVSMAGAGQGAVELLNKGDHKGAGGAVKEAGGAMLDSLNPFKPGLRPAERFGRTLNVIFLGIGLGKGVEAGAPTRSGLKAGTILRRAGFTAEEASEGVKFLQEGLDGYKAATGVELFKGSADSMALIKEAKAIASTVKERNAGASFFDQLPKDVEANMGVNPLKAIKGALGVEDFENAAGGTVTNVRKAKDYHLGHYLARSPLSVIDEVTGDSMIRGLYEDLGGELGKKGSVLFRNAEREITANVNQWQGMVDNVVKELDAEFATRGEGRLFRNKKRERLDSEFVDLIEKPLNDLDRIKVSRADTPMGRALRTHDELTQATRQYIIDSRREMGIETPDDWGITDKGYFRHMFLGDLEVKADGLRVGNARTYVEAQKMALDHLSKNPKAQIVVQARQFLPTDPTVRISNRAFWRTVSKLAETVEIPMAEVLDDIRGTIGRQGAKQKFSPYTIHRTGAAGFSRDYAKVLNMHTSQVARTQALSKLNRALTPVIEDIRAGRGTPNNQPLPGLAGAMEAHLGDIWGTPTKFDVMAGELIRWAFGDRVAIPSFAMRNIARHLTSLQYNLKLRYSSKGAAINAVQPMQSLLPYADVEEIARAYKESLTPSIRKMLKARGVLSGATQLETPGILGRRRKSIDPFRAASEQNRAVGYLVGYRQALANGLDEVKAHANGLSWAERVEFDNSQWNAPAFLRSPGGRVLGQFKGFTVKNLERISQTIFNKNVPPAVKAKQITKLMVGQMAVGGLKSMAPLLLGTMVAKLYVYLKGQGMTGDEAADWVDAVVYGAPALLGADVSGSVTLLDVFGKTGDERLVNFFGGPTVGTANDLLTGLSDYMGATDGKQKTAREKQETILNRTGRAITPLWRQGQAIFGEPELSTGKKATEHEAWMLRMGFTPVRQSRSYTKADAKRKF